MSVLLIFLYLLFFGCRLASPLLNAVVHVSCAHLQRLVYPLWDKCVPAFAAVDAKIGLAERAAPHWSAAMHQWDQIDSNYDVTARAEQGIHAARAGASFAASYIDSSCRYVAATYFDLLHPTVCFYGGKYKLVLEYVAEDLLRRVSGWCCSCACLLLRCTHHIYTAHLQPFCAWAAVLVLQNEHVVRVWSALRMDRVVAESARLYVHLKLQSAAINAAVQSKTDFVLSELGAAQKLDLLKHSLTLSTRKNFQMISDLTNDFAGFKRPAEHAADSDSSDYPDDEITITLTRTLTKTLSEATAIAVDTIEALPPYSAMDPGADISAEVSHIYSVEQDASVAQINYELAAWEDKIRSTLQLAEGSLVSEFAPYLDKRLSKLKEAFSANFTELQTANYLRYKEMHRLIALIDKDSEFIRTHNQTIAEPEVDRQVMRDRIKEARDAVELQMKYADDELSKAYAEVLTEYFSVAQSTVDVLESFAETIILDFSARLKALIEYFRANADFDDKIVWNAWKKFHQVKESIFQIRDKIFDEAHAYKANPEAPQKPKALEEWDKYVRDIKFHIGFLTRDNDEYLFLVRAKANVAYQQREGLTYELLQAATAAEAPEEVEATTEALSEEAPAKEAATLQGEKEEETEVLEEEEEEEEEAVENEAEEEPVPPIL